ncbi:MAG: AraC family transcriptional regulator [Bacteroidia bacterium]
MRQKHLPVYDIEHFRQPNGEEGFYANAFRVHLKKHHFILTPHKHDFFTTVLFTKGTGQHTIDFTTYDIKPGIVFTLSPGQTHSWTLSDDIDGFIFFHTKDFFNVNYTLVRVEDYPFFYSFHNPPLVCLKNHLLRQVETLFSDIYNEYQNDRLMKFQKIRSLVNLVYIELSRVYLPQKERKQQNQNYLGKLRKLEQLLDENYKTIKSPAQYAKLMGISEKHLNRICKECLNKTTTDVITDRVMLETKRLLIISKYSVSEVAGQLGYYDNSYFSRLFKKRTGQTPAEFIKKHHH